MSETNEVVTQEPKESTPAMRPALDIFEDATGITVQADMPGVSRDRLDVRIDSDSLIIEGRVDIAVPDEMDPLYADVHATRYEHSFALSRELDGEHTEASLRNGVLTLRVPKREAHKARKIEVRAV